MMNGLILAVVTLLAFGFGEFYIQKSTRATGVWKTLFVMGVVQTVIATPFALSHFDELTFLDFRLLGILGLIVLVAAPLTLRALQQGKLSVMEPLTGLELPITVLLSVVFVGEVLTVLEVILIGLIFLGVLLAVTQNPHERIVKSIFEKGIVLGFLSMLGQALTNFLIGVSSQEVSATMTLWWTGILLTIFTSVILLIQKDFFSLMKNFSRDGKVLMIPSILNGVGWITFGTAMTILPIGITTALTESYIVLAVILGIVVNREKLYRHQYVGIVFSIASMIALAVILN